MSTEITLVLIAVAVFIGIRMWLRKRREDREFMEQLNREAEEAQRAIDAMRQLGGRIISFGTLDGYGPRRTIHVPHPETRGEYVRRKADEHRHTARLRDTAVDPHYLSGAIPGSLMLDDKQPTYDNNVGYIPVNYAPTFESIPDPEPWSGGGGESGGGGASASWSDSSSSSSDSSSSCSGGSD